MNRSVSTGPPLGTLRASGVCSQMKEKSATTGA